MGRIDSKFYKIILIASSLISVSFSAEKFIDGISLIVNNEPITTYEIQKYKKALNISTNQAIDLLIQKKVEDREIKLSDIRVDSFDVEEEMRKIAKQNRLTLDEFKEALKDRGIDIEEYKEELKNRIKRERLYQKIASSKMRKATKEDLKRYYKNNPQEFSIPQTIDIIEYSSPNKEALLKLIKAPMYKSDEISSVEKELNAREIHPKVLYILTNTKEGSFTPILKANNRYVTLYIKKKKDIKTLPFEDVKNAVFAKVMKEKEKEAIREYFEKIKAEAKILVVRKP